LGLGLEGVITSMSASFAERERRDHCGLMPANLITLAHFAVSSAMRLPKSAGEPANAVLPMSARRAFVLGSARPALISWFKLPMISMGVSLGTPMPLTILASNPGYEVAYDRNLGKGIRP